MRLAIALVYALAVSTAHVDPLDAKELPWKVDAARPGDKKSTPYRAFAIYDQKAGDWHGPGFSTTAIAT
jgi:hypothetical protein